MIDRLQASPLGARLTRSAFWSLSATGINRAAALAVSIAIARLVGRARFGELGVIQSTVAVFGLVAGAGASVTATRYVASLRQTDPGRAGRIIRFVYRVVLTSAVLAATAVIIAAPLLASRVLAEPRATNLLRIAAVMLVFDALNGARTGVLAGFEAFRSTATVDLACGVSAVVFNTTGALVAGVPGALVGMTVTSAVRLIGYSIMIRRAARAAGVPLDVEVGWSEWRVLVGFSVPALLATAAAALVNWLCHVIVVNQPAGYDQIGLFNAAGQWRTFILLVPTTVSHAFMPILSNLYGLKEHANYRSVLYKTLALNSALALAAAVAVCAGSRLILASYGAAFAVGRTTLLLLAVAAVIAAPAGVIGQAITSAGRMWAALSVNAVWAVVLVAATWRLRVHGAAGFALANVIAYVALAIVSAAYLAILVRDTLPRANP